MKKSLLFSLALFISLAVVAQKSTLKNHIQSHKQNLEQNVAVEPSVIPAQVTPVGPSMINGNGADVVSIITIGTSANAYGYGYNGGQKTMVWADDNLKALTNIHRMGPGTTPPGFSGYLGLDLGLNMGATSNDWVVNQQIYASTLNTGGDYFLDAARYPQGAFFTPNGSKSIDDAYFVYFAPNLSNTLSTWGGLSYGTNKLTDLGDSTKHLYWYTPPPYTYIPDGFHITAQGVVLTSDIDQNWESGTVEYQGNIIVNRGVWNDVTKDIDYELDMLIECPTTDNQRLAMTRIATDGNGDTAWVVALGNNGDATQIGNINYYPILYNSTDGGQTWSDPIAVQLDGPDGLSAIVNDFLSDYRITQIFDPPYPPRDEIGYTTAFDCDLVVDKWGNPHVLVTVGVTGSDDWSIALGDSLYACCDIFTSDFGNTWCAVILGKQWTFKGSFGDLDEYNRLNGTLNPAGDKVLVTWIDTQIPTVTDNINPDVFARGYDLVANKITEDKNGNDLPINVTFLSDVTQQAYFMAASYWSFTDGDKCYIPIVTELLSDPTDPAQPVTFKYIPDFYFEPGDFTIPVECDVPIGVQKKNHTDASVAVYPNPVKDIATLRITLKQQSDLSISVSNLVGQTILNASYGPATAGVHEYNLDASMLQAGIYFCTVEVNGQKYTKKMIVE